MVAAAHNSHYDRSVGCIDDVQILRSARSESGYLNVYYCRKALDGTSIWIGKFKRGGHLRVIPGSRSPSAAECARKVAAWYRAQFGDRWPAVLAARKVNPFVVRRSQRHGGYVAAVWVLGAREEVTVLRRTRRDRWAPTDELAVFPTVAAARAGLRRYLVRRYGLLAEFVAYRERAPAPGAAA